MKASRLMHQVYIEKNPETLWHQLTKTGNWNVAHHANFFHWLLRRQDVHSLFGFLIKKKKKSDLQFRSDVGWSKSSQLQQVKNCLLDISNSWGLRILSVQLVASILTSCSTELVSAVSSLYPFLLQRPNHLKQSALLREASQPSASCSLIRCLSVKPSVLPAVPRVNLHDK